MKWLLDCVVIALLGLLCNGSLLQGFTHQCKTCPQEPSWSDELASIDAELKRLKRKLTLELIAKYGADFAQQKVNPHAKLDIDNFATFNHWGTSLCWWAVGVGQWEDQGKLDSLLDLIFSDFSAAELVQGLKNGSGLPKTLGLTQARYNIGGSPWQPIYDDKTFYRAGAAVESFLLPSGQWNWTADAGQRKVLAGALKRNLKYVQAFSNSPPWWMTKSQSSTGAHKVKVAGYEVPVAWNNLADENVTQFASYLAAVSDRFASHSEMLFGRTLVFDSMSALNEPGSLWWHYGNNQEGCHISYRQQALLLDAVAKELGSSGTAVVAAEGNKVFQSWRSVYSYSKYSPATLENLALVDTHQYSLDTNLALVDSMKENLLLKNAAAAAQKELWVSEFGTGAGPLEGGLRLAKRIINGLLYLNVTTWTLWQVVGLQEDYQSPDPWSLIIANYPPAAAEFRIAKQYYAYKQFTAFIRPGSRVLGGCRLCALSRVDLVVSLLPDNQTAVVVAVHLGNNTKSFKLKLNGATFTSVVATYLTDADTDCSPVPSPNIKGGSLKLQLQPQSVTTFVVTLQFESGLPPSATAEFVLTEPLGAPSVANARAFAAAGVMLASGVMLVVGFVLAHRREGRVSGDADMQQLVAEEGEDARARVDETI